MVKRLVVFTLLLISSTLLLCAQQITGIVTDSVTGETLPAVNIRYKGHDVGTSTDLDGHYSVERHNGWTLVITYVGYQQKEILVTEDTPSHFTIQLKEDSNMLTEVVVKSKGIKYSRKNNPAVDLMRRVIAAKKQTRLENHDYYTYNKYQKLSMAINNYHGADSTRAKRGKWADESEVSPYNGKTVLPMSMNETVKQYVYRKNPQTEKEIIHGERSTGLNELLFTGENINEILKEAFRDIDIYDEYIEMLQHPFMSPIANGAIGFYHFYIADTVKVDNDSCYHLQFFPANPQDFGFNGDLYVLKDSSLHVKKVNMALPRRSDVNYVKTMHVDQQYTKLDNGDWVLTFDDMWAEMVLLKANLLVVRNTRLSDYAFDELPKNLFRGKAKTKALADSRSRTDDFWNQYRSVEISEKESGLSNFMAKMQKSKAMRVPIFIIKLFVENYIETSKAGKPSKVDIGPMMSTFSANTIDGFRMRLGARTNAAFNPHLFLYGHVAHGFKSKETYYEGSVTYSINKKQHSPFEFPQRNIMFESSRDVMSVADKFLFNSKDNMIASIRTEAVPQMFFYNRQKLSFTYETDYGLAFKTWIKAESNTVAGSLEYVHWDPNVVNPVNATRGDYVDLRTIRTTEIHAAVEFAPGQVYINTKQRRYPLNFNAPRLTLSHTMGIKGFLGGQYNSNITEFNIFKRQWLGSFGFIDLHLNAAAQWNKVPFPMLLTPPICLSYIEQEGTMNMLHNMEFFMDRRLFWSVSWSLNGKLFNRIPLLKKLKLREYIAFKGVWGKLTDKNNPDLNPHDPTLFKFPGETSVMPVGAMAINPAVPYMEFMVGIRNIFKFFSVEYVRRLNYADHTNTYMNGVRFGLQFTF